MNHFADYFDAAYAINLPERLDRRRAIAEELQQAEIPLRGGLSELFPAIAPEDKGGFRNQGAHGCFMSHLGALKKAHDKGVERVLIMEDDLSIGSGFVTQSEVLVGLLQKQPWDMLYLGHALQLYGDIRNPRFELSTQPIMLAHFYAVNRSILADLIEFLEAMLTRPAGHPDGGPMDVDGAYCHFRATNPNVKTLVSVPSLGWQRASRSDITPAKWDSVPGIRTAVSFARRGKEWVRKQRDTTATISAVTDGPKSEKP